MYNEILNMQEKCTVLFDMDGVLCEYRYGEGSKILKGDTNVYLSKRPIQTVIKFLKECLDIGNDCFIITSCVTKKQFNAKIDWISKNIPFFSSNRVYCVFHSDFDSRIEKKINKICEIAKIGKTQKYYVIEDTHEILSKLYALNEKNIIPVHVINIII